MIAWRLLGLSALLLAGCAGGAEPVSDAQPGAQPDIDEPPLVTPVSSDGDPAGARPVEDWPGILNASHEGNIYFAGQPDIAGLRRAFEIGVEVVVNLRTDGEMGSLDFDEAAEVEGFGMRYVTIPITPASFSKADVSAFAAVMADLPGPVLVHCRSANRAGALWAAYLALQKGVDLGEAIERGRKAGMKKEILETAVRRILD